MTEVNFFWHGDDFRYIDHLVLKSHLKVGHKPILWFSGKKPDSSFWKETEKNVTIKNAYDVFDVREFISTGGNNRTGADLWRFHFLYSFGGIYCDTDVFALRKFPDDEWIVGRDGSNPNYLGIAIIKAPANHEIFLECIANIKKPWGNVALFSELWKKHFGNTNPTHENQLFYPYPWTECSNLLKKKEVPWDSYSIHYAAKALGDYLQYTGGIRKSVMKISFRLLGIKKPKSVGELDEIWCKENPETLLGRLSSWLNE